jgi:8-oxo-dGTP diphosphatase
MVSPNSCEKSCQKFVTISVALRSTLLSFCQIFLTITTHLAARGWDIVGGHIEPGESAEEAARREAYEEAGARLRELHMLGYQRLRLLGPRPVSYRYSYPDSYQVFYWAQIEALDEFISTEEARERALFAPDDARELPFVRTLRELYLVALQAALR